MLSCQVIRSRECRASNWAGGTTSEIYIHPPASAYAERSFDFRISSATVMLEESPFTPLPGYRRHLMVLDGHIEVVHEGRHKKKLGPYETDFFDGAWSTKSFGRCRDFNLMLRTGWQGELGTVRGGDEIACPQNCYTGLYSRSDDLRVTVLCGCSPVEVLDQNDFLIVQSGGDPGKVRLRLARGGRSGGQEADAVLVRAWRE